MGVLKSLEGLKETMTLFQADNQKDPNIGMYKHLQIQRIHADRQEGIHKIIEDAYATFGKDLGMLLSLCLEVLAAFLTSLGLARRKPCLLMIMAMFQLLKLILQYLLKNYGLLEIILPTDNFSLHFVLNFVMFFSFDHASLNLFLNRCLNFEVSIGNPAIFAFYFYLYYYQNKFTTSMEEKYGRSQNLNRENSKHRNERNENSTPGEMSSLLNNISFINVIQKNDTQREIIDKEVEDSSRFSNESNCSNNHHKILNRKVEAGPELIYHASLYGHKNVVRNMLANHSPIIDVSKKDEITGFTPFHLACTGGHLSVVQQLMKAYGNEVCIGLMNRDLQTGLELAAQYGRKDVVQTILNIIKPKHVRCVINMIYLNTILFLYVF